MENRKAGRERWGYLRKGNSEETAGMEKREAMVEKSVAPGFRFHPTDEELVWYYLRRKVYGKPFSLDAISEIDLYKFEPDFLPGLSKLQSGDRQWFFFSALDRKYVHGLRTNRATAHGYWKTTGKDKPVLHNSHLAGFKKTLVYHFGRPPRGTRTDWVMHEYKLADPPLPHHHHHHHPYVLCRIFRKSGSGPKNADHYGAPFVEEDWEDTDPDSTVCCDVSFEDPYADDDDDDDHHHPLQDLVLQSPPANQVENFNPTVPAQSGSQASADRDFYDLLAQDGSDSDVVRNQNMPQPNDDCNGASVTLPDELFSRAHLNSLDDSALGPNSDNDIDIREFFNFDCLPEFVGGDADQTDATEQEDTFLHLPSAREQLPGASDDSTGSSSRQVLEDDQSRTVPSKEGLWSENIPTHPAFASEFPTKDMASRLATAAVESSTSIHVTAGMIRITEMPIGAIRSGLEWSFDKTGSVNVVLSFELPPTDALPDMPAMFPSKLMVAAASRGWLHFLFFWVLFCVVSIDIGTCIYAK